jgi:hypothetical protein
MLTSLLTVGVVSGVAAVRDAAIDEMGDLSQAMVSLDQSYYIQPPLAIQVHTTGYGSGFNNGFGGWGVSAAASSGFVDAYSYRDCGRVSMKVQEFPRRVEPAPGPVVPDNVPMPAPAL